MRDLPVRDAAVAGLFYPADAGDLARTVDRLVADVPVPDDAPLPRAVVVPHAGYVYSGSTAALAYARVAQGRDVVRRVVVVGPPHRVPVRGVALPGAAAFRTPLGEMPVAHAWAEQRLAGVAHVAPQAHRAEHSVEVQLPFLQRTLGEVEVVPLLAGDATGEEVADVLDALVDGPDTLLVISSDLSHYLPYDDARRVDAQTLAQIAALDGPVDHRRACGATPVNGVLVVARRHRWRPTLLGACSSGDTAGDRARVVGYSAWSLDDDAG